MATLQPGGIVGGRYQLERPIGTGGMAVVWLAHDRLLDRKVAVKILAERYASDPDFIERFRREASAAAGLSHPNIVTVFDRGEADGSYYIVMEHLPGPDLKAIIKERGRLDPRQAVDAALQVLAAVGAAHRRNVIHRDIKPQNVLVSEDGNLKVTDFGIARAGDDAGMTDVGSVIGTAQYLSPEQARGEEVTTASDCYSVGILLYEMLTGRVPFDGEKPVAIAMRQINEAPLAPRVIVPTLAPQLNEVVMKALEKRPSSRYRTAEDFTQALLAVRPLLPEPTEASTQVLAAGVNDSPGTTRILTNGGPITGSTRIGPPPPRQPSAPPPARKRKRSVVPLVGAVLGVLLLAVGAFGYLFTDIGRPAKFEIPSVRNQTEDDAKAALTREGFTRFDVERRNDANVDPDFVIGTDPDAGARVEKNKLIRIFVSTGPESVVVPTVVGQKYEDAVATLSRQKDVTLIPTREDEFSDTVPAGSVIRQEPRGGRFADDGSTVTLTVSKGPEPVTVPSVLLLDEQNATQTLENLNLKVVVTTRETTKRSPGTVVDQDPKKGAQVQKGSTVTITVAKEPAPPEPLLMPDFVGNPVDSAQSKLQQFGFNEAITSTRPDDSDPGTVIEQTPPAKTPINDPENTQVSFIVSSGPTAAPPTDTGSSGPGPGTP